MVEQGVTYYLKEWGGVTPFLSDREWFVYPLLARIDTLHHNALQQFQLTLILQESIQYHNRCCPTLLKDWTLLYAILYHLGLSHIICSTMMYQYHLLLMLWGHIHYYRS